MSKYVSYSFYHIEFAIHKQAIVLYFDDNLSGSCYQGYEPLISINGLHQLHILIFFLAAFHVAYSAITMLLGRLKVRKIYICVCVCLLSNQKVHMHRLVKFLSSITLKYEFMGQGEKLSRYSCLDIYISRL